jgi:hypothetical protein
MFKPQNEITKIYSIHIDTKQEKPIFSVTINQSSSDYAVNAYAQKSNDYFKYEINNSSIKISITPHQQMGDTDTLFANARSLLSRNSIITSRDSCEIESAYSAHMKKHGGSLSNSKDNHNIERENHGSSFSF